MELYRIHVERFDDEAILRLFLPRSLQTTRCDSLPTMIITSACFLTLLFRNITNWHGSKEVRFRTETIQMGLLNLEVQNLRINVEIWF